MGLGDAMGDDCRALSKAAVVLTVGVEDDEEARRLAGGQGHLDQSAVAEGNHRGAVARHGILHHLHHLCTRPARQSVRQSARQAGGQAWSQSNSPSLRCCNKCNSPSAVQAFSKSNSPSATSPSSKRKRPCGNGKRALCGRSADLDEGVDGRAGVGLGRGLAAKPQLELRPLPGSVAERSGLRVADARDRNAAQAPREAALDEPRRVALPTATAPALQPQPLVPSTVAI